VRSELVCFQETDIVQGSSRCEQEFFICPDRKEDTYDPARNGASHRHSYCKLSELSVIVKECQ
jgi:hypothetical protein